MNIKELRNNSLDDFYTHKNVHNEYKHLSVDELKNITSENTFPFWVMTLNVLGDLNIATVIRSAHLFGAEKCVVFGRRKIDNRGLVGAANYTPVEKVNAVDCNLVLQTEVFKNYCLTNNLVPLFIEQGGKSCYQYDWSKNINRIISSNRKPILVLGTEREGIPKALIDVGLWELQGDIIAIPQRGVIRSHNLSMAFGIVTSSMVANLKWY